MDRPARIALRIALYAAMCFGVLVALVTPEVGDRSDPAAAQMTASPQLSAPADRAPERQQLTPVDGDLDAIGIESEGEEDSEEETSDDLRFRLGRVEGARSTALSLVSRQRAFASSSVEETPRRYLTCTLGSRGPPSA